MELNNAALLIVDYQNDFCPGGALGVSGGDKIAATLNEYIKFFQKEECVIIASRDWHPPVTSHFKKFGGDWPRHCIQNSVGARFNPKLELPNNAIIISKGMRADEDSYSAFDGFDEDDKPLNDILKEHNIYTIYIGGLATDYCVKSTVLDALGYGFKVRILMDAVKGVDLNPDDSKKAIDQMLKAGAERFYLDSIYDK